MLNASGQRTYEHAITEFVAWYWSEPRLAFNRTVVLRYRIHLEQQHYAPATINLRLAAVFVLTGHGKQCLRGETRIWNIRRTSRAWLLEPRSDCWSVSEASM